MDSAEQGITMAHKTKPIPERIKQEMLLKLEEFKGKEGCWEWTAYRNPRSGYGQFSRYVDGKAYQFTAHRAAYAAINGDIPSGLVIAHKCDNPKCFNPSHLFATTQKGNNDDMFAKGRQQNYVESKKKISGENHWSKRNPERIPRGESQPRSKLKESDVIYIRSSEKRPAHIAKELGVSPTTVCDIRKRKIWKHIA
jgi:hypothetical protein